MVRLLALFLLSVVMLSACSGLGRAQKEASEAVVNLSNKAVEIKDSVDTKLDQIDTAKNSVVNAVDAVNKATDDLKTVTNARP